MGNDLKSLVGNMVDESAKEKLNDYIRRYGEPEEPGFVLTTIKENLSYSQRWKPETFQRVKSMRDQMLLIAQSQVPLPGHLLFTERDSYNCCEVGILTKQHYSWDEGEAAVCKQGSCHISGFRGDVVEPITSISGGHFFQVPIFELKPLDFYNKTYWVWGQSACASGGVYFTIPMRRWVY